MRCLIHMLVLLALLGSAVVLADKPNMPAGLDNLPKFPHAKRIFVTAELDRMPVMAGAKDPGGINCLWNFTLQSLAGLAALSVADHKGDAMIWLNHSGNDSYNMWLEDVLTRTHARRMDQPDPKALVREFIKAGVLKGYILYRADSSPRAVYEDLNTTNATGYDESINVATTLAPLMGGIIVEETAEPVFIKLGLKRLFDARGKSEAWAFENYGKQCRRDVLSVIDPKVWHCREYSVATRSFCVFGTDEPTSTVMAWMKPNSQVVGWNRGGEDVQTMQSSRYGLFQTATNWCLNLPVMSTLWPGQDIPWESLNVNPRSSIDPLELDWAADNTHYTSFAMTDGDNVQWAVGGFYTNTKDYWPSPSRTQFPIGWTLAADTLAQLCPSALHYTNATGSKNDQIMLLGGGYYYAADYGASRENREAVLSAKIDQIAATMNRMNIRTLMLNNFEWDGKTATWAYQQIASKVEHLAAIFAIQYTPYNAGLGKVVWVTGKDGAPIPVISARYALWAQQAFMKDNGPPAFIASRINEAAHTGPPNSVDSFDWTIVHVWSYFRRVPIANDLFAEEVDQKLSSEPDVWRGVEPLGWCIERLAPHVRVVTPEELAWRMRLHLKTRETLTALANGLATREDMLGHRAEQLKGYQTWVKQADLDTSTACANAYLKLQKISDGRTLGTGALIH